MRPEPESSLGAAELRDLSALADGSLPADRRAEVQARVEADPALRAALEEQRRAVEAVRAAAAAVETPAGLRHRIDAQRGRSAPAARRRRLSLIGGFAVTAAAAAIVVALVLPADTGGPSAAEAAELSVRPPTEPAPGPDPDAPALLDQEADGVPYPNWERTLGWSASGMREDDMDGRDAMTVHYDREGKRVGYTILSGDRIDPPEGSRVYEMGGERYWIFDDDGRQAVVWYREGRTCVMSGEDVPADVLVKLAAWKGRGAVSS